MKYLRRTIQLLALTALALNLASCGTTTGGTSSMSPSFGLDLSEEQSGQFMEQYKGVRLDVIVPFFEPGIPADSDDYEKLGVWPELRRLEAIRFAQALREELQDTGKFGDVYITPDAKVAGDLFVSGEILKSNGEDVEIRMKVHTITGQRWMNKRYKHRVKEYHWQNIRTKNSDPYQPIFHKVADDVVKLLNQRSQSQLARLRASSEIIFANEISSGKFSEHMEVIDNKVKIVSLPADDDPKLKQAEATRVIYKTAVNDMQTKIVNIVFNPKSQSSYIEWQKHSISHVKAARKAKSEANSKAFFGALLLIGAAVAADANDDAGIGTQAGIAAAAVGGGVLLRDSFQKRAEGKYHLATLNELGQSLNIDIAPTIVEIEGETVILRGGIKNQFKELRRASIINYERLAVPNVQL